MIRIPTPLKNLTLALMCCVPLLSYAEVNDSAVKVKWGYIGNVGPSNWGKLDPSFSLCATGKTQSPIGIVTKKTKPASNNLQVNYTRAPLDIMNNGTTTLTLGQQQTIINDGHTIQVNFPLKNTNETIVFNGQTFHLIQFHVHSPSENQINGQAYPIEIHFVHQGENGTVAVIGVFMKGGASNYALQSILANVPKEIGKEEIVAGKTINPAGLLPDNREHYSFQGSLTTPPCTEGLQWLVMPSVMTATPAQILELRKAIGEPNARDVQPLNKREIQFSSTRTKA